MYLVCKLLTGAGSLSSYWPAESRESVSSDYTQHIWKGDVWQSVTETRLGQSCPAVDGNQRSQCGMNRLSCYSVH